jgi:Uma2 family endonuclease
MAMTAPHELQQVLREFLPDQGRWDEAGYLWLTDDTNRLIEFTDGAIEVLPAPTDEHQTLSQFLLFAFGSLSARAASSAMRHSACKFAPASFASPISCCSSTVRMLAARTATGPGPISSSRL